MAQVTNLGEDSYETQIKIEMPPGVSYINVHKVESASFLFTSSVKSRIVYGCIPLLKCKDCRNSSCIRT